MYYNQGAVARNFVSLQKSALFLFVILDLKVKILLKLQSVFYIFYKVVETTVK